jgi:hypothetical protein
MTLRGFRRQLAPCGRDENQEEGASARIHRGVLPVFHSFAPESRTKERQCKREPRTTSDPMIESGVNDDEYKKWTTTMM